MKIGDKYVLKDDMETIIFVDDIVVKKERNNTTESVVYHFENQERKFSMTKIMFEEFYRPYSALERNLKEVESE